MGKTDYSNGEAEILALRGLEFLACDDARFAAFLAMTGACASDVAAAAGNRELLAGVLDHILADDKLITQFAAEHNLSPDAVQGARRNLPGATMSGGGW